MGIMPVNGTGVFGPGQLGFGLASTTPGNETHSPITQNHAIQCAFL